MKRETSFQTSFAKEVTDCGWYVTHSCIEPGFPDLLCIRGNECLLFELKDLSGEGNNVSIKSLFTDRQLPWLLRYVKGYNSAWLAYVRDDMYGVYHINSVEKVMFLLNSTIYDTVLFSSEFNSIKELVNYVVY